MPWSRHSMRACQTRTRPSIIATDALNIRRCATVRGRPKRALQHRRTLPLLRTTMHRPKLSTACTRPKRSSHQTNLGRSNHFHQVASSKAGAVHGSILSMATAALNFNGPCTPTVCRSMLLNRAALKLKRSILDRPVAHKGLQRLVFLRFSRPH